MAKPVGKLTESNEWQRTQHFSFGGKGGFPVPEAIHDLSLDADVTVVVKGRVRNLSFSEGKEGRMCGLEVLATEISVAADNPKPKSFKDALDADAKRRRA